MERFALSKIVAAKRFKKCAIIADNFAGGRNQNSRD